MISTTNQVNTFVGGMNLDTTKEYLETNKYIEALDIRVVTNDAGTAYGILNIQHQAFIELDPKIEGTVIGTVTISEYLIVVTISNGDSPYNTIYRISDYNSSKPTNTIIYRGYLNLCTTVDASHRISIVANYEADDLIKIYFTDGLSLTKVLNIMSDDYLPDGDEIRTNGEELDLVPLAYLPPLELSYYLSGSLHAGVVQYAYVLYHKYGTLTALSSMSGLIPIVKNLTDNKFKCHFGQPLNSTVSLGGCVLQTKLPDDVDVASDIKKSFAQFDRCKVYRIFYEEYGQEPIISIIHDGSFDNTAGYLYIEDSGADAIATITREEFNAITGYQFTSQCLEILLNRLFSANINEISWVPKDADGNLYDARAYRCNKNGEFLLEHSTGDTLRFTDVNNQTVSNTHDCINPYNLLVSPDYEDKDTAYIYKQGALEFGGTGKNIEYDFVYTNVPLKENTFGIGSDELCSDLYDYQIHYDAILKTNDPDDSKKIKNYDTYTVYGLKLDTSFTTEHGGGFENPEVVSLLTGYMRDELYRFGIVFYNSKWIPSPVLWIGDIRMPDMLAGEKHSNGSFTLVPDTSTEVATSMRESGSEFLCNTNYVIVGRKHSGDENGTTTYYQAKLKADDSINHDIRIVDVKWDTEEIKESSGTHYLVPNNRVMVGRKHSSDENGTTHYAYGTVVIDNVPCTTTSFITTSNIEESDGIEVSYTGKVMVGRYHTGDENGRTNYTFATVIANPCDTWTINRPYSNEDTLFAHSLGIRFNVKTMPENAVAYEIVRCKRTNDDRSVLSQGALGKLITHKYWQENDDDTIVGGTSLTTTILTFAIPLLMWNIDTVELGFQFYRHSINDDTSNGDRSFTDRVRKNIYRFVSPEVCLSGEELYNLSHNAYAIPCLGYGCNMWLNDKSYTSDGALDYTWWYSPVTFVSASGSLTTIDEEEEEEGDIELIKRNYLPQIVIGDGKLTIRTDSHNNRDGAKKYDFTFIEGEYFIGSTEWIDLHSSEINGIRLANIIPYNGLYQKVTEYQVNIDGYVYVNWAKAVFGNNQLKNLALSGPCGPTMLLSLHDSELEDGQLVRTQTSEYADSYIPVINIKRDIVLYGGDTYENRINSSYISTGAYGYKPGEVITYGGDTYIGVFDYNVMCGYQDNDALANTLSLGFVGAYIPLESMVNLALMMGDNISTEFANSTADKKPVNGWKQTDPVLIQATMSQDKPYHYYNTAYSTLSDARYYSTVDFENRIDDVFENRIYGSDVKISREAVENWAITRVANYIDVDSTYLGITNLKTFNSHLLYFQREAVGIASVSERSLILDENNAALVLGSGDVLARFDYLTTMNGSCVYNDKSIINAESTLHWYDVKKNEICGYGSDGIVALSKTGGVLSYLNATYDNSNVEATSVYDKKYNEVWFNVHNDKSLIFNKLINAFSAFYTFTPNWNLCLYDNLLTLRVNEDNSYLYAINPEDELNDRDNYVVLLPYITFCVNTNPTLVKVFDNVLFTGNFYDTELEEQITNYPLSYAEWTSKDQNRLLNMPPFDYREYTYRTAIPRAEEESTELALTYPERFRGNYLICKYTFENSTDFMIPLITTNFRYSRI